MELDRSKTGTNDWLVTVNAIKHPDDKTLCIKDIRSLDNKLHLRMEMTGLELKLIIERKVLGTMVKSIETIYLVPETKVYTLEAAWEYIRSKLGTIHCAYRHNLPDVSWLEYVLNSPAVYVINTKRTTNEDGNIMVHTRVLPNSLEISTTVKDPDPTKWVTTCETIMLAV